MIPDKWHRTWKRLKASVRVRCRVDLETYSCHLFWCLCSLCRKQTIYWLVKPVCSAAEKLVFSQYGASYLVHLSAVMSLITANLMWMVDKRRKSGWKFIWDFKPVNWYYQDQLVYRCKRLLLSILYLVMGHLSIDLSPHTYMFPIDTTLSDSPVSAGLKGDMIITPTKPISPSC